MATPSSIKHKASLDKFKRLWEEDRLRKHPDGEVLAELKAIRRMLEQQPQSKK